MIYKLIINMHENFPENINKDEIHLKYSQKCEGYDKYRLRIIIKDHYL